ncbi:MAG: hypothetical protein ACPIB7_00750 [Candidatus Puniceispirillaceae bacterium]
MRQISSRTQQHRAVPVHSLGISQILAYGLLFYGFAQLKQPLAVQFQLSELYILTALSLTVGAQACLAPVFGYIADRYSALSVMCFGFFAGSAGLGLLAILSGFCWPASAVSGWGWDVPPMSLPSVLLSS